MAELSQQELEALELAAEQARQHFSDELSGSPRAFAVGCPVRLAKKKCSRRAGGGAKRRSRAGDRNQTPPLAARRGGRKVCFGPAVVAMAAVERSVFATGADAETAARACLEAWYGGPMSGENREWAA